MSERTYLLGVLVYNGREVVPRCLESVARLRTSNVEVVVFDDCSPSDGWSNEVEALCASLSIGYYRSPRNLGIPRNMSLLMESAVTGGFEIVGLLNSDIVVPANLIESTEAVLDTNTQIASVTPWSNNVSAFSLPMADADVAIAEQSFVSTMSAALFAVNGARSFEIPTGVGYCMMIPAAVIRDVGVMDPIFGRGYCEEVDWSQRARQAGYRHVLGLGSFVYHEGSGTNRDEGLLAHGMTTIIEHELIVRDRYPSYESDVAAFFADPRFPQLVTSSMEAALGKIVGAEPFDLVVADPRHPVGATGRTVTLSAADERCARISANGVNVLVDLTAPATPEWLLLTFGRPESIAILQPGRASNAFERWAAESEIRSRRQLGYPSRL